MSDETLEQDVVELEIEAAEWLEEHGWRPIGGPVGGPVNEDVNVVVQGGKDECD